jgi:putative endonuclease
MGPGSGGAPRSARAASGAGNQSPLVSGGDFCHTHFRASAIPVHEQMNAAYFVYILASGRNGTLYIGVTNDLARRMAEHKGRFVPGFTRKYQVDQLVYFEAFASILEARAREHSMKRWRRAWKIELIEKLNPDWRDLTHDLSF